LLAPPSSGKTTFLRALAGRLRPGAYSGEVKYNGHSPTEFSPERSITYVAQTDTHIPNLTARETVQFAYDIQHSPTGVSHYHSAQGPLLRFDQPGPSLSLFVQIQPYSIFLLVRHSLRHVAGVHMQ